MGALGEKSASKNRKASARPAGPGVGWKIWRFIVDHPKGVLIGSATLLGLIVVFQNWRPTRAYLLVTDVSLPFILWALIFMLVGYLTGKWIEWGWRQRKIRKGTYKPRVSPEALADVGASLDDRLERREALGEGRAGIGAGAGALGPGAAGRADGDAQDPATLIDRGDRGPRRVDEPVAPRAGGWVEPGSGPGGGPGGGGKLPLAGERPGAYTDDRRPGGYSPAAHGAALGSGPAPRHRPADGRYGDYADYGDAGRYVDQAGGGHYVDQGAGRYVDQGAGRYVDQGAGRYVDQGAGRYVDQGSGPRYGDYADYGDAGRPDGPGRRGR